MMVLMIMVDDGDDDSGDDDGRSGDDCRCGEDSIDDNGR